MHTLCTHRNRCLSISPNRAAAHAARRRGCSPPRSSHADSPDCSGCRERGFRGKCDINVGCNLLYELVASCGAFVRFFSDLVEEMVQYMWFNYSYLTIILTRRPSQLAPSFHMHNPNRNPNPPSCARVIVFTAAALCRLHHLQLYKFEINVVAAYDLPARDPREPVDPRYVDMIDTKA